MIWNYIKITLRNLSRSKFHAIINIVGLSVGLATFIFVTSFIWDEISYDKHHEKHERIYRLESKFNIAGRFDNFASTAIPMGPAMKFDFPEVESFCRFMDVGNTLIKYGEKEYYEQNFLFTDSTVFDIFTHEFILGSAQNALNDPFSIVITKSIAHKYFGNENPLGETIETGTGRRYKVTGVIKDLPPNSHYKYDALLSNSTIAELRGVDNFNSLDPMRFWNIGVYTYILLNENNSISDIMERMPAYQEKYMKPVGEQINATWDPMFTLLADTHFVTGLGGDMPKGNMAFVYILSAVAVFVLLIAIINYMNMATAQSSKRAREVGLRKVVGAVKSQLIQQFVFESILQTILALIIALFLVLLFAHDFNQLAGKEIDFIFFKQPGVLMILVGIALLVGFAAGSYPAFYLSSFKPIAVLKGSTSKSGKEKGLLRKVLVVIQFFIAIVMITGTLVVSNQLSFLREKNLGFEKENLVFIQMQDSLFRSKEEIFKKELLTHPNILGVSGATGIPGDLGWIQVVRVEQETEMVDNALYITMVDHDYVDVLGLEIVEGRDFNIEMSTDVDEAVIVNEACVRELGWTDEPLGKKINWGFDLDGDEGKILKVIGVVKDFNFMSLHNRIEPLMIFLKFDDIRLGGLSIRISEENKQETLAFIEEKWNEFGAKRPFVYYFVEENMDEMYQAEDKLGTIFSIATFLTIFIALLGLLGLSSFVAERKTKEIGIRKVVGASVPGILALLLKEFVILIGIAFVLSVPVAWWRLNEWVSTTFIYHDKLHWYIFAISGVIALIIGVLTVSFHILRAARSNPVDAIKYE